MSDSQAPPQLEHEDWTAGAVADFCDWLVRTNLVKEVTVMNWKRGFSRVLEEVEGDGWEQFNVSDVDEDLLFRRFDNAAGMKFKPASLAAYKKRFKTALAEYERWMQDRSAYQPSTKSRSRQSRDSQTTPSNGSPPVNGSKGGTPAQNSSDATQHSDVQMLEYPFPVRQGVVSKFALPTDLRPDEAERIGKFIASIAVRSPAALPSGESDA